MASGNFSDAKLIDCLLEPKTFTTKYREFKSAYVEQQQYSRDYLGITSIYPLTPSKINSRRKQVNP